MFLRHLVVDDEISFEEVVTVHVPTPKIIHDPTPGRRRTSSNSNIYFNNYPENDKQLYPFLDIPVI